MAKMKNRVFDIEGMYCENCEKLICGKLSDIDGVSFCEASFAQSKVSVSFDSEKVSSRELMRNIESLGYTSKKDRSKTAQLVSVLVIIIAVYLILNHLGLLNIFNIFPTIESSMELSFLFVIGLLTSVHCIAMCGGINLSQSVASAQRQEKAWLSNLLYNLGRVTSYTLIGGIAGSVGSVLSLSGAAKGIVAVIAGVAMIIMSLRMLGVLKACEGSGFQYRRRRLYCTQS